MKKIIIFILLLGLLFGTNNYQELNSIAIITNIGITKLKNEYKVIYQEIIPSKENNKLTNKYKYYETNGTTINDCFKKMKENISKNIYLEHLENVIINSDDKEIIYNLNQYFQKDLDNFTVVFTPSEIEKVIKYNNNYNYINSIIEDELSYREIKKANLEKEEIKVPTIKITDNILGFYKYDKLGDNYE